VRPTVGRRCLLATAAAATAALAGCTTGRREPAPGTLALTVRNDRAESLAVDIGITDATGSAVESEAAEIAPGVARSFEFEVDPEGRHEVAVDGDDWRGRLAWEPSRCRRYAGTVAVDETLVSVEGECAEPR